MLVQRVFMNKRRIVLGFLVAILIIFVSSSDTRIFFNDSFVFLKTFFINPTSVGAVIPSSSFLADAITKHIKRNGRPIRVLEVGAGTGSMTRRIAEKLRNGDILDVIEIDTNFCEILNEKFEKIENININCLSILDWNPGYRYDFIVSGLPFNAFDADFVNMILKRYQELIRPGGIISYFEYIALAKIKLFFLRGEDKDKFSKTITTTAVFRSEFEFDQENVFANIPPACVHHLRFK